MLEVQIMEGASVVAGCDKVSVPMTEGGDGLWEDGGQRLCRRRGQGTEQPARWNGFLCAFRNAQEPGRERETEAGALRATEPGVSQSSG